MAGLGYDDVFVVFYAEVLHDEVAALGGVLAHAQGFRRPGCRNPCAGGRGRGACLG